ncbi:TonB-dependent receptor plug domain protein, partial [Bordetella bronchiseptica D989]
IPATMPDGQGQTSNIDIGSAGRVEVLRGPFSALYGNSSGGVVQVFTEQGSDPPEATGSAAAGSFGTWRYGAKLRGASAADGLDYVLDFNRFTTEGYRDHSAARKNLGNARLGLRMDDGSRLTQAHRVPGHDAAALEPRHAVLHRSARHVQLAGQRGGGQAGVRAQQRQQAAVQGVERMIHGSLQAVWADRQP